MKTLNIDNRRILFLGYAVPEKLFDEVTSTEKYPQIQGTKLIWRIIRGIEESSGCCLDLLSAAYASDYPGNSRILFSYKRWKHCEKASDVIMPFINLLILKHVTRFVSALFLVLRWLIKYRNVENKHILIYAIHSPFMLAAILASLMFNVKITQIVPDLPEHMGNYEKAGFVRKISKKADIFLTKRLLRRMNGLVVLTKQIAEFVGDPKMPFIVMEGSVSLDELPSHVESQEMTSSSQDFVIMYAGGLNADYGIQLLLDAFKLIHNERYKLWFCGKGEMESALRDIAKKDKRIVYWGFLPNKDILMLETKATVLINPRPSNKTFTKYSFPSKILEYMCSGRPVIATNLPGIPFEYHKYLYVLEDETPHGLAKFIEHISSKSPQELADFGRASQDFVRNEKNYVKQGKRIYDFITSLE